MYIEGKGGTLFDLRAIVVVVVFVIGNRRRDNRHGSETSIGVLIGLETSNKSRALFAIIERYLLYRRNKKKKMIKENEFTGEIESNISIYFRSQRGGGKKGGRATNREDRFFNLSPFSSDRA